MGEDTLYQRLGEAEGISAVVEEFYERLLEDEELGPFFDDADVDLLRRTQTEFLCDAAGGPQSYDGTPVRAAHLQIPFTPAHIQRALELLEDSLDAFGVPDSDAELVVQAIAAYEAELLASPED